MGSTPTCWGLWIIGPQVLATVRAVRTPDCAANRRYTGGPVNVATLIECLDRLAPVEFAAEWDNVGLLAGSSRWPLTSVLLTNDLTQDVVDEAIESGANAIIAYHPPIFEPLKAVTDGDEKSRLILESIRAGIALYSPHTALDAAPGGVNDWLVGAFGDGDVAALEHHEHLPATEANKVVTMCPAHAVSAVHQAMSAAGAGIIGDYAQCSFRLKGEGTFFGGEAASPAVGVKGRVEHVEETRLEMVCGDAALANVLEALRRAHPYEEPPIEVYPLRARPRTRIGQGRMVRLREALALDAIIDRLKVHLGVAHLNVGLGRGAPDRYSAAAVCAGAGGSLLDAALDAGAELFLTGEMRHHDVLDAIVRGCTIIVAGHTETERGYLPVLAGRLRTLLPDVRFEVSQRDAPPLTMR